MVQPTAPRGPDGAPEFDFTGDWATKPGAAIQPFSLDVPIELPLRILLIEIWNGRSVEE
jgi:hypothetical protein